MVLSTPISLYIFSSVDLVIFLFLAACAAPSTTRMQYDAAELNTEAALQREPGTHCLRMRNVYGQFSSRTPSLPRGRTRTDKVYKGKQWYTKHSKSVKLKDSIFPKDCCTADFIRSYLTLNKPSWASET